MNTCRLVRWVLILSSIQLGCVVVRPRATMAPPAAPVPAHSATMTASAHVEEVTDETGRVYRIEQGEKAEPSLVGCADGQREAFVDHNAFPAIAGCLGAWEGLMSLRTPTTGTACGDDLGPCGAPADLCAPGWHVCGSSGTVAELRQVSAEQCEQAGGGRFSAAFSHCKKQRGCEYDMSASATYECFPSGWCSEPACCGRDCGEFGACTGGVWPDRTHIPQGTDQGCGAMSARRAGGVLCCR
ncbi:MAG: hypothetical protein HY698_06105 [Deltaproteobacteria bacterium]|nr:hypothetical protein [Deltaproteobacteria bacterium]